MTIKELYSKDFETAVTELSYENDYITSIEVLKLYRLQYSKWRFMFSSSCTWRTFELLYWLLQLWLQYGYFRNT